MAKGNNEVIKSFLVSLGFQVDDSALRKFIGAINGVGGTAGIVAKSVIALGVAAEAMVGVVAHNMEKLYYASKRTGATVGNIQALEYAFEQVGISGSKARDMLEQISKIELSSDPGKKALVDILLGKNTAGMEKSKVLMETLSKLFSGNDIQGTDWASQIFGMSKADYGQMKQFWPQIQAAFEKRNELLKASGVNAQEAAEGFTHYINKLKSTWEMVELLALALAKNLLPGFDAFIVKINQVLETSIKLKGANIIPSEWMVQINSIIKAVDTLNTALGLLDKSAIFVKEVIRLFALQFEFLLRAVNLVLSALTGDVEGMKKAVTLGAPKKEGATSGSSGSWEEGAAKQSAGGRFDNSANLARLKSNTNLPTLDLTSAVSRAAWTKAAEAADALGQQVSLELPPLTKRQQAAMNSPDTEAVRKLMLEGASGPHPNLSWSGSVNEEEAALLEKNGVRVKTDIHVHGVQSPEAVARIVAQQQQQTYSESIRNQGGLAAK